MMAGRPIGGVRDSVAALLAADLAVLSGAQLVALARELESVRRQLSVVDHRVVAEMESRRLAGEYARSSTADLLVSELRISPGEAKARVARAEEVGPRRTLTGEALPPLLPECAAACLAGEISPEHVAVIAGCLDGVPPTLDVQAMHAAESALVEAARHQHPAALRRTAAMVLARLDPDGVRPRDQELERRRDVTLSRNRDGSGRLTGRLTLEATAIWDTVLDALSAPQPTGEGVRDERTAGQRRHDALAEAGQRLLRSRDLPAAGGVPVTVLVRTTAADLADATTGLGTGTDGGVAVSSRGDLLSLSGLLGCGEAEVVPVFVDDKGAVLRLGRARRLASSAQRLALAARDGGCSFPGCERPAGWTEVHHVVPWHAGGSTDLDNMCLVCRYHHREFEPRGWAVHMTDGVPEWIPPPFLDRQRRPRRNTAHHPLDIDFDVGNLSLRNRVTRRGRCSCHRRCRGRGHRMRTSSA